MEARRPYPLDERGVPVLPAELNVCYDICLRGIHDTNRHHLAFQRRDYKTPYERAYREAQSMVVAACICKHADLHATYLPPRKPDLNAMVGISKSAIQPTVAEVFIRPRNQANLEAL